MFMTEVAMIDLPHPDFPDKCGYRAGWNVEVDVARSVNYRSSE